MVQKIDHVVITTANPKACFAFYEKCGFVLEEGQGRYALFAGDFKINVHIRGQELSPHAGIIQPGSADFCFAITDDLGVFTADLTKKGLRIALGPVARTGVRGPMQSIYLRDPDNNLVEFASYEGG